MRGRARPRRGSRTFALVASVLWLAFTPSSLAQQGGAAPAPLTPAVVAVIDYQRLMRESEAALSIRRQVEAMRGRYEGELAEERARLEAADKALDAERPDLSADAYRERRRAFEGEVAALQRLVQERRQQLDAASSAAFQEVRDAVVDIIGELGTVYRFNVVLPRSDVLVFSPEVDLTNAVMDELNARLPDVPLPVPED